MSSKIIGYSSDLLADHPIGLWAALSFGQYHLGVDLKKEWLSSFDSIVASQRSV